MSRTEKEIPQAPQISPEELKKRLGDETIAELKKLQISPDSPGAQYALDGWGLSTEKAPERHGKRTRAFGKGALAVLLAGGALLGANTLGAETEKNATHSVELTPTERLAADTHAQEMLDALDGNNPLFIETKASWDTLGAHDPVERHGVPGEITYLVTGGNVYATANETSLGVSVTFTNEHSASDGVMTYTNTAMADQHLARDNEGNLTVASLREFMGNDKTSLSEITTNYLYTEGSTDGIFLSKPISTKITGSVATINMSGVENVTDFDGSNNFDFKDPANAQKILDAQIASIGLTHS